jgi:hypothetical protein
MSVITGIVVILMTTSTNTYNVVNNDAVVQGESELVRSFINEIAIEATACDYATLDSGDDCVWFLSPDNESTDKSKYCYYFILHEAGTNILRYGKYKQDASSSSENIRIEIDDSNKVEVTGSYTLDTLLISDSRTKIKSDDYRLLAEHITDLSMSHSSTGLITVNLKLSYGDISDYTKSFIFAGRNMN